MHAAIDPSRLHGNSVSTHILSIILTTTPARERLLYRAGSRGSHDPSNSIDASGHLPGLAFPCGKRLPRWPSECVLACGPDALDGHTLSSPANRREMVDHGAAREM